MVKSPKIRHSKSSAEPVTIDLSAEDVSRVPPESQGDKAADKGDNRPKQAAASAGKAAAEAKSEEKKGGESAAGAPAAAKSGAGSVPPIASSQSTAASSETPKSDTAAKPDVSPKPEPESTSAAGSKTDSPGAKGPATGPSTFGRDAGGRPASPPPPPPRSKSETPRRGTGSLIAAGLVGGLIVLGGAAGAYYGGLLPQTSQPPVMEAGETDALRAEIETLRAELTDLRDQPAAVGGNAAGLADVNARIESVSVLVEEMRSQLAQLSESVSAGDAASGDAAALEELRTNLSELQERVAGLPAQENGAEAEALRTEIARVEESVRSATETAASASQAANTIGQRIDALDQSLRDLAARVEEQDRTPTVALAIAASALKAAIDRGTPFMAELETYAGLSPDAPEVAALRDLAASGVPTRAQISAEMNAVAVRIIDAGRVIDPNAGVVDRLWASAQSLVTVRPVGQVEGDDVPAIVARMEAAITAGDYERAIAEYETLPQDARAAGADFIEKVQARHAADRLIDQALSAALRA